MVRAQYRAPSSSSFLHSRRFAKNPCYSPTADFREILLADVSGILTIRKVINHGNPRWCVSSLVDGKRSQRFFKTKEDAHTRATSLRNDPRAGDSTNGALRLSDGATSFKAVDSALHLQVRQPHAFRAIPHLDPALHARLISALQRPDLKPQTRAKIEKILKPNESHPAGRHHPTCQPVSAPIRSSSETPCEIVDGF